jgi:hypothetical protein
MICENGRLFHTQSLSTQRTGTLLDFCPLGAEGAGLRCEGMKGSRPTAHAQLLRNPFERHGRLAAQPPRDLTLFVKVYMPLSSALFQTGLFSGILASCLRPSTFEKN